jgi:hypothetical protein
MRLIQPVRPTLEMSGKLLDSVQIRRDGRGAKLRRWSSHDLARPAHKMIEFELQIWRRRPDLKRGWRFCRAIPGSFARSTFVPPPRKSHLLYRMCRSKSAVIVCAVG